MFPLIASIVVVCVGMAYNGWIEDGILPIDENVCNVASHSSWGLGRKEGCPFQQGQPWPQSKISMIFPKVVTFVKETNLALLKVLGFSDGDKDAGCCYREGCDCGRSFSRCPMCGEPRSGIVTWIVDYFEKLPQMSLRTGARSGIVSQIVDNVDSSLQQSKSLVGGHSVVSAVWWVGVSILVLVVTVLRIYHRGRKLSTQRTIRSMKKTIDERNTKLSECWKRNKFGRKTIKSLRKTIGKKEEKLSEEFQQIDILWGWYDQVEELCKKKDRQLYQREMQKEELAKTIEYLARLNEHSRRREPAHLMDDFVDTRGHRSFGGTHMHQTFDYSEDDVHTEN